MDQQTYEEIKTSIREDRKRPAIERYQEMVASGLIDAGGKVLVGRQESGETRHLKSVRVVYGKIKQLGGKGYKVIGPVKVVLKKRPAK